MTRTVTDAALLLSVLAGKDDADPATAKQPPDLDTDYPAQLRADGLRGARIGILRSKFEGNLSHHSVGAGAGSTELLPEPAAQAELERTILTPLREGGATLVDDLRLWSEGEVIPTPSHLLDRISPISPPFPPVLCAFSPSRRGGSNELPAGTQGQETAGKEGGPNTVSPS